LASTSGASYSRHVPAYLPDVSVPYAIGSFRAGDGPRFPGLAVAGRVKVLDRVGGVSVAGLLDDWDSAQPWLAEQAASADGTWFDEVELTPQLPWVPGQVLQAGANYRKHVVDIVVSEMDDDEQGRTPEQKRAFAEDMMDARARSGQPYVFLGSRRRLHDRQRRDQS
jgi:hypothetical protein